MAIRLCSVLKSRSGSGRLGLTAAVRRNKRSPDAVGGRPSAVATSSASACCGCARPERDTAADSLVVPRAAPLGSLARAPCRAPCGRPRARADSSETGHTQNCDKNKSSCTGSVTDSTHCQGSHLPACCSPACICISVQPARPAGRWHLLREGRRPRSCSELGPASQPAPPMGSLNRRQPAAAP